MIPIVLLIQTCPDFICWNTYKGRPAVLCEPSLCKMKRLGCCMPPVFLGLLREEEPTFSLPNELLLQMTGSSSTSSRHYSLTHIPTTRWHACTWLARELVCAQHHHHALPQCTPPHPLTTKGQ